MTEVKFHQRKIILLFLLLLLAACVSYMLFKSSAPHPVEPVAVKADSISMYDSIEPQMGDTHRKQISLSDSIIPVYDSAPQIKKPVVLRTKGTLRLQSAQGFWFEYTGEIVDGEAHGKGIAVFENGNRYEGDFIHNKRNGFGKALNKNGDRYEGQWKNDRFNGKGTYIWKNGDRFEGYFKDAQRNGKGKLYNKLGELLKEGIWKDDELMK